MTIEAFTDGASTGKVGAGGWAYTWRDTLSNARDYAYGEVLSGTTNSRTEMIAVIELLKAIPERSHVEVYCDSSMVVNGIKEKWTRKWRERAIGDTWLNSRGVMVANRDLWEDLETAIALHEKVRMVKIKGHTNGRGPRFEGNRTVDRMAQKARKRASKKAKERGLT